jgi:GNAT superfamily N-acetyltransferase
MTDGSDLLLTMLREAAAGRPPSPDGSIDVVPAPAGPVSAVVAFTGHHVIAADIEPHLVQARLPADDLSAPMGADFLLWMAGWTGRRPGSLDIVLAWPGADEAGEAGVVERDVAELDLVRRDDLMDHPRVRRASRYRTDLAVYEDSATGGVLVIGRGLARRWEAAFEVAPAARGRGVGRRLAGAARSLVDPAEPLFVQVAPGNAASLRAVIVAGYRPIGGEVLFAP